ncbi:MAG TPA: CAP domain-containing protein [Thermoanaerobaculia bacterium]|nr:CAP domain-containing protein [Thermoanaerobaculia bacterium]
MKKKLPRLLAFLLVSAIAVSIPCAGQAADASLGDGRDERRLVFLGLINRERGKLGLAPVRLAPALSRAAQAQTDDMAARGYYDLASPDGREIDHWVGEQGYAVQLLTEKIAKTDAAPESIASQWGSFPDSQRASLFHPDVEELGVGVTDSGGLTLYAFVLARSQESYLAGYVRHLFEDQAKRFLDTDALREEMLGLINEARAEAGAPPLTLHTALNRAAQAHAEEAFQALRRGGEIPKPWHLSRRVQAAGYRARGALGETIVQGALTPEETLSALLGGFKRRSNTLGKGYAHLGLGLAFEQTADGFFVVWVQCLARPFNRTPDMEAGPETDMAPPEGGGRLPELMEGQTTPRIFP